MALPETCYLFSSFRGNGEDGLHLAYSVDGLTWTAVNRDRSYLAPAVGTERLMRDPCIVQGPDRVFHMVWTCSWWDRAIGYASSRDLIHWSKQAAVPVMGHLPKARNCWAPEVFWDEAKRRFLIIWSTTIPGRFRETQRPDDDNNHRIYSTTTRDFKTFTKTKLFFDGGFNVIDATIIRDGGAFYLIVKDETKSPVVKKHLRVAKARTLEGPYRRLSKPFTASWVEGPTALRVGQWVYVYYDVYTKGRYGASRTKDFKTWQDVSRRVKFPKGTRHGSVISVSGDVIERLLGVKR